MTGPDEQFDDLRQAALGGDPRALEELLVAITPLVRRRCARVLPYAPDAEEAAQDALLAVATKLDSFSGHGSFAGWVSVVATNCARSTYRSLKRRELELGGALLDERPDPRTTSVIAGSRLDLLEALDALERRSPQLVPAVVLRDLASLPYAEIADQTGVPVGTVKARVHEARIFLRRRLEDRS